MEFILNTVCAHKQGNRSGWGAVYVLEQTIFGLSIESKYQDDSSTYARLDPMELPSSLNRISPGY